MDTCHVIEKKDASCSIDTECTGSRTCTLQKTVGGLKNLCFGFDNCTLALKAYKKSAGVCKVSSDGIVLKGETPKEQKDGKKVDHVMKCQMICDLKGAKCVGYQYNKDTQCYTYETNLASGKKEFMVGDGTTDTGECF